MCTDTGEAKGCRDLVHIRLRDPVKLFHQTDLELSEKGLLSDCSVRWLLQHHPDTVAAAQKV